MATSDLEHFSRVELANVVGDTNPIDAGDAYSLASNALHLSDEVGQVLGCWSDLSTSEGIEEDIPAALSNSQWFVLWWAGPFVLRVGSDGLPYPVRARMAFRSATGPGSTTNYRLVLGSGVVSESDSSREANGDNVLSDNTTATTSTGYDASGLLTLNATQTAQVTRILRVKDGSTDNSNVEVVEVYAVLWANGATDPDGPRVTGVSLAEYIGT